MQITRKKLVEIIKEEVHQYILDQKVEIDESDGSIALEEEEVPDGADDNANKSSGDVAALERVADKIDTNSEIAPAVEALIGRILDMSKAGNMTATTVLKRLRDQLKASL